MINYIDYSSGMGLLNCEINNYLYCLKYVCLNRDNVRRFAYRIIILYLKLDSLFTDYSDGSIEEKRTLRKASRYINGIKRYIKKIKKIDSSIFSLAAKNLEERNNNISDNNVNYLNRYSRNNWDNDQISRTLIGDINSIIKRKRKQIMSSENSVSSDIIFFDDYDDENKKIDLHNEKLEKDNVSDDSMDLEKNNVSNDSIDDKYLVEDEEYDFNNRLLTIYELCELKKEIDQSDDTFVDIDNISDSQSSVIKSYVSILEKYNEIENSLHLIYDNSSIDFIIKLYEHIYDFVGFLINEMFEQIIGLSKISCQLFNGNLYKEKNLMDKNAFDVFGKYNVFIAKIQNYLILLDEKKSNSLSTENKEYLSKYLWDKYRLEDINPISINEAVSLDLMSFINKNVFTFVQTVSQAKRNKEYYKKYDLDIILEHIDFNMEKYFPELVFSMQKKIENDLVLTDDEKNTIIFNIKKSFARYIGFIHGITELPSEAYNYCLNYIMNKVFLCEFDDDLEYLCDKCINDIYNSKLDNYKRISFLDRLLMILSGNKLKPNVDKIRNEISNFCNDISKVKFNSKNN